MIDVSKDRLKAFFMLLPSILLIALFVYGFIANTLWISLTDWGGVAALAEKPVKNFVGLRNYVELFTGFIGYGFRQDLVNAVYYSVMLLAGAIGVGMFIAILLDCKPKGEDIFRTIFLYPMSLSFIVTGTIWRWLLAPQGGVNLLPTFAGGKRLEFRWLTSTQAVLEFNWQNLLQIVVYMIAAGMILIGFWKLRNHPAKACKRWLLPGVGAGLFAWLGGHLFPQALFMEEIHGFNLATLGIILATVWQYSGYTMALYLAGFTGIPQDLRDAAMLDGASDVAILPPCGPADAQTHHHQCRHHPLPHIAEDV